MKAAETLLLLAARRAQKRSGGLCAGCPGIVLVHNIASGNDCVSTSAMEFVGKLGSILK